MEDVEKKLWNIGLIIEEIEKFPQTYETILKEHRHNGTYQTILRRKLNNLCRDGHICKTSIPGTRFGKAVYYVIPKNYYFLVEGTRTGTTAYAFFEFEKRGKSYMVVENCWRLAKTEWIKCEEKKVFFDGDVLKFI
jgi:hypothetical protein